MCLGQSFKYSRDLNTKLVWCSNGQKVVGCQMVWYLNTGQPRHLNTRQMDTIFSYVLLWYSNGRSSTRYSNVSGIQMVGIQIPTVLDIFNQTPAFSVWLSDHLSETGPFNHQTQIYHFNSGLVWYSDGYFNNLIFFRASVLSEVQTSRSSQLPASKNLLVLGKVSLAHG